jgi:signal transduction histidine kinase
VDRSVTSPEADDDSRRAAFGQLVAARVPVFSAVWLGTTLVWGSVLVAEERLSGPGAAGVVAGQAIILGVALVARRRLRPELVATAIVVCCVALGAAATLVFRVTSGHADYLAFVLLTLYLSTSLAFGWGWRRALALLGATVGMWVVVLPHLDVGVPIPELIGAIVAGSFLSVAIAEGYARAFRVRFRDEGERRAIRERERVALAAAEEARAIAEAATRSRDRFLAIVSHDLRTPLTAAVAWVEALRMTELDAEQVARAIAGIERSLRSSLRLIQDLLDVTRIASDKLWLQLADVDLRDAVVTACDDARLAAEKKGLAFELRVPHVPVVVRGDADRLRQVVANVVDNAVKFTRTGGRVEVGLACAAHEATLTVRDTGIGIPADLLPHVFEAFRQERTATRHGGLGLGLAITRHLVGAHGGTIEAESVGESHGATFRVRLPLAASAG